MRKFGNESYLDDYRKIGFVQTVRHGLVLFLYCGNKFIFFKLYLLILRYNPLVGYFYISINYPRGPNTLLVISSLLYYLPPQEGSDPQVRVISSTPKSNELLSLCVTTVEGLNQVSGPLVRY